MALALRYAARSHTGLLRDGNEDSVYAGPRLLAVADGMGGHAAGEVASAVAIAAIASLDDDEPGSDLLDALRVRAESANQHLRDMVAGDPALDGMGTTLVAMLFAGTRLGLLHVGDSRAYQLRGDVLTQITHDHTLVQTLVDEGRITEADASTHPQRSLVTRVLTGQHVELDLSVREARVGDRYLLCSDGLTGPVASLDTLHEALRLPDVQEACDQLVKLALRGGGPDNVTVIVADVVEAGGAAGAGQHPVVAGAAADAPQPAPAEMTDSAAGRAHAATAREQSPGRRAPVPAAAGPRRGRRTTVAVLLALAGLVLGAGAGWAYVRSQYYVGVQDGQVAVFRGVTGSLAGVSLSSVETRTDLTMARLSEVDSTRVERGIVAAGKDDAMEIVSRLERNAAAECQTPPVLPTAAPSPGVATPTTTPTTTPTAQAAAPGAVVPSPVATPSVEPCLPVPAVR